MERLGEMGDEEWRRNIVKADASAADPSRMDRASGRPCASTHTWKQQSPVIERCHIGMIILHSLSFTRTLLSDFCNIELAIHEAKDEVYSRQSNPTEL